MKDISRKNGLEAEEVSQEPIGCIMRGERHTLGLTLEGVHQKLKVRPEIIDAIENNDIDSIGRPQYVSGYIRSYAKMLNLNPDEVISEFVKQCDLPLASQSNQKTKKSKVTTYQFSKPRRDWGDRLHSFTRTTSLAIPIVIVLGLIGGAVYGSAKIVRGFQKLEIVPTETQPIAATQNQMADVETAEADVTAEIPGINYDELYERQALQTPVITPRFGRIADVDVNQVGVFASVSPPEPVIESAPAPVINPDLSTSEPVVTVGPTIPEIQLLPADESWVRLTNEDGEVLFEKLLQAGENINVPVDGFVPILRKAGNANQLFVRINGQIFGPVGQDGETVVENIPLTPDAINTSYDVVSEETLQEILKKEQSYLAQAQN